MKTSELSESLKRKAVESGLCKEWTEEWGDPDLEGLCQKYKEGIDFCINNKYPGIDIIKTHFGDVRLKYNIFADDTDISLDSPLWAIFNGECTGKVEYSSFGIGELYICDSSDIEVSLKGNTCCYITLLDDAKVKISSSILSKVRVYTNHPDNVCKKDVQGSIEIKPYIIKR